MLYGLVLLAFGLRVYRLDYQSLWRDEVDAVIFASRDPMALLANFTKVGENGPLFFLSLHFWIGLVGHSEFAIRLPSVFFGVLAVWATYRLGREVIGREIGLIGALLMAVSPYHIWYGQEAKMYSLISFMAPFSLILLMRAARDGQRWLWLAWAALMVVFLYVHLFAVMMGLVAAAWLPFLVRQWPRLTPRLAAALVALVLVSLPVARWLIPAALTPTATGYYPYSLGEMVTILLFSFSMGLRPTSGVWPVSLYGLLLMLGLVPLVAGRPGAQDEANGPAGSERDTWPSGRGVGLLLVYLVLPVAGIWLVSLSRPTFTDRYLIVILPAFYLLMAAGVAALHGLVAASLMAGHVQRVAAAGTTGAALVLAVTASVPFIWAQTHNPYKADFRAATAYLAETASADDLIIFLMPYVQRGFAYYHPQPVQAVEPPYTAGMSQGQVDAAMRTVTAGRKRVWLFLSEAEFWDPEGMIPQWFERNGRQQCRQDFAYIEVRCYDMRR